MTKLAATVLPTTVMVLYFIALDDLLRERTATARQPVLMPRRRGAMPGGALCGPQPESRCTYLEARARGVGDGA